MSVSGRLRSAVNRFAKYWNLAMLRDGRLKRAGLILGLILGLYLVLHLALVPMFSISTKHVHKPEQHPGRWGLAGYQRHEVASAWGISLPAWFIPGDRQMPIIIVLTGSGGSKYGTITRWPALYLHERGYNIFLVDTRGQGHSAGIKTFGIGEAVDLVRVVDYLSERFPNRKIGAVGFSLGAASLLRAAGMDNRLAAVVAYAPYAELDRELIEHVLYVQASVIATSLCRKNGASRPKDCLRSGRRAGRAVQLGLSPTFTHVALKLWSFTLWPVPSPEQAVSRFGDRALLLMHNAGDPEIPVTNTRELFEAADTPHKQKLELPYSGHHPPFSDKERFRPLFKRAIQRFFDTYLR